MGVSRTVIPYHSDINRFQSKIVKIFPPPVPCILRPRWKGSSWNWVSALGSNKSTSMKGLPGRERSLTISSAVWIQYTNITDGRTDRHRPTAKTALTHSVARYKPAFQRHNASRHDRWTLITDSKILGKLRVQFDCTNIFRKNVK